MKVEPSEDSAPKRSDEQVTVRDRDKRIDELNRQIDELNERIRAHLSRRQRGRAEPAPLKGPFPQS